MGAIKDRTAKNLQFPLNEQCSSSNHLALAVQNHQNVRTDRSAASLLHVVETSLEIGLRDLTDGCEDAQDIDEFECQQCAAIAASCARPTP